MSPAKILLLIAIFSLFLISTAFGDGEVVPPPPAADQDNHSSGDGNCGNCTICPYTCHTPPPPPATGGGYPSYGAPPPPSAQANCPPAAPVQCCQNTPPSPYTSPPSPFYSPYGNNSGSVATVKTVIYMSLVVYFVSFI